MKFSARQCSLKVAFVVSGKSQADVARDSGLSRWALNRIVNGHLAPKPHEIARIARALDMPADRLFSEDR